jgi:SAM-dependent methyltransferase
MDLTTRVREPEWMDRDDLDPRDHAAALAGLARLNLAGGSARLFVAPLRAALDRAPGRKLVVLDVAAGAGDNAIALAKVARRSRWPVEVHGCDRSPAAVRHATDAAAREELAVRFHVADAFEALPAIEPDLVLNSLFVHHLDPAQAVEFFERMREAARLGLAVVDLLRSRLGYALAWLASRTLTTSAIVRYDALVSVRAAYTEPEVVDLARRANLERVRIEHVWPERFRMTAWRV